MPRPPITGAISILAALSLPLMAQNPLPLDFSHNVQAVNAIYPNNSSLGPEYYSGTTLDFVNVTERNGQAVDARVTVLGSAGAYEFVGWIPDYNSAAGQPSGDLGVYYRHTGDFSAPTGGIAYTITFYEGGGGFSNTTALDDLRILIYDHDGEPGQSESIRTYMSDGFTGYQIRDGSGITAAGEGGSWRFDSGGANLSETGPEGGFIAHYQNTSSIRFDLFGTTLPSNPAANNGIFASFDGDLSLTHHHTGEFGQFVAVPEPATAALPLLAAVAMLLRRRRHSAQPPA